SPEAEQALFDQLDEVLEGARQGRMVKVVIQAARRFQNLVLNPQEPAAFCTTLRRQALAELEGVFTAPWPQGGPGTVLLTAPGARVPGLVADLGAALPRWAPAAARPKRPPSALEDFGSHLLDETEEPGTVVVLADDAPARGAHSVAPYFQRGDIACGHL